MLFREARLQNGAILQLLFGVLHFRPNNTISSAVITVFIRRCVCVCGTGCSSYWCFHLLMFGFLLNSCYCNTNIAGGECCQTQAWWPRSRHTRTRSWCPGPEPCSSWAGLHRGLACKLPDSLVCTSSCFITPTVSPNTTFSLISVQSAPLGPTCFLLPGMNST